MWSIQYNQSSNRFELTQDGLVILELETKDLDQIGQAVTKPLFPSTRDSVLIVKNAIDHETRMLNLNNRKQCGEIIKQAIN